MTNTSKQRTANNINRLKEFVKKNQFDDNLEDDDPFFFALKKDDNQEIIFGDGSEQDHLNLMVTSKYLLSFLSKRGVFHIDGTYKITSHGYPLVIFGLTDIQGKFHPIVFMITSHETELDFHYLYSGLIQIAHQLDINHDPKFIMQDACRASFNAAVDVFGNDIVVLMCFYHVKANLLKHKHLLKCSKEKLQEI